MPAIRQISPAGPSLQLPFVPANSKRQAGGARWDVINHPRTKSTIQFGGVDLHTMTLDLLLDDQVLDPGQQWEWTSDGPTVHDAFELLHRWAIPDPYDNTATEPPVLQVGWYYGQQLRWVLNGEPEWERLDYDRHGRVIHCAAQLQLIESNRATTLTIPKVKPAPKPAAVASSRSRAPLRRPSQRKHTVVAGDRLWRLSLRYYGHANGVARIVEANKLADPDLIRVGQQLVIP